jgi:hypothetical protein
MVLIAPRRHHIGLRPNHIGQRPLEISRPAAPASEDFTEPGPRGRLLSFTRSSLETAGGTKVLPPKLIMSGCGIGGTQAVGRAAGHPDRVIGHIEKLAYLMAGHHERATSPSDLSKDFGNEFPIRRINLGERLVSEQAARRPDAGERDFGPATLSAGELI